LSSKSSSDPAPESIALGRVFGHRGNAGELTVRSCPDADRWVELPGVWIGESGKRQYFEIERARAYRDRLVLKLVGVDDGDSAHALRGQPVEAAAEEAPELPEGAHYVATVVGMRVEDEQGEHLGSVESVIETGAADLLRVIDEADGELLIPMVDAYVIGIEEEAGRIKVRLPQEMRDLNR